MRAIKRYRLIAGTCQNGRVVGLSSRWRLRGLRRVICTTTFSLRTLAEKWREYHKMKLGVWALRKRRLIVNTNQHGWAVNSGSKQCLGKLRRVSCTTISRTLIENFTYGLKTELKVRAIRKHGLMASTCQNGWVVDLGSGWRLDKLRGVSCTTTWRTLVENFTYTLKTELKLRAIRKYN